MTKKSPPKKKRRTSIQIKREELEKLGGAEWILTELAAGRTEVELARDVLGINRTMYYKLRKELGIPKEEIDAARRAHARFLVDESARILKEVKKNPNATSREIGLAKARAENNLKRATMWNRRDFGQKPQETNVKLSLSGVFIQALSDMSDEERAVGEVGSGEVKELQSGEG